MPVLFVGHGNPMNAIEQNEFHLGWKAVAGRLPRPDAVLCVSAHWETDGARVTSSESPETIHDFYGFPQALFDVRYPAPGSPSLAARVADLVTAEHVRLDPQRGLDHGAWSVLIAMYPEADVPVVQLGMDTRQPGSHHLAIARQLVPLRDENVLVLASGNMVHNLRMFNFRDPAPLAWAEECDRELRGLVTARDHETLAAWPQRDSRTQLAVPTPEHYDPLFYAIALQAPEEKAEFFNVRVTSAISMTSVLIGGPG
jgi:4,5-DOPA dioxygenase extradiol